MNGEMDANRNHEADEESKDNDAYHESKKDNGNTESLVFGSEGEENTYSCRENDGERLLHRLYASVVKGEVEDYREILKEIIQTNSIDLNTVSFDGDYVADVHKSLTPLQLVCGKGDEQMLLELLKININVNASCKYGKNPLNIACLHGHLDAVKLLISTGADTDAKNTSEDCDTALITTAACYQPELESAETYFQIGQTLLETGACPNQSDANESSAIHIAVTKSDVRFTQLLLEYGANPDVRNNKFQNPLCVALDAECYQNAKLLLKYGCEINEKSNRMEPSSFNSTPLHIAITKNNLDMILTLLNAGADPSAYVKNVNECVYQYSSVLHLAAFEEQLVTLWLLLVKGGAINNQHDLRRDTPLLILARKGSLEGVKMLLRFGADVELESQVGTTPIWAAVRENHLKVLHVLLETCCSLEIPSMEYHMYMPLTPLEVALRLQSWNMALVLLNAGANYKTSTLNDAIPASAPLRGRRIIRTRAAYRLPPEDHQALKELRTWNSQPKTLKHLCRATLRSYFTRHLPKLLKMLSYPARLQNYLYLKQ